jgi:HlyD family secretion protein
MVLVVVLVLAGAGGGYWYWRVSRGGEPVDQLRLHGNVEIREVLLAFNAAERITAMRAQEGDAVKAGDVLATLDTHKLEQAVQRAEAQTEAQRQVVLRLERGTRPEEVRKARADVEATQVAERNAERTWKRLRALNERELAPDDSVDNARAAFEEAAAHRHAAEEALKLALAGPREEDIAGARASLRALEAELALARRNLADATLQAPSDGVIRDRLLEPGDMASPQTPVYTLALTEPLWVRAYVAEPDLGRIRPGMHAAVQTDSFPDKRYAAWIGFISPTAEFTPKTVQTERVRTDLVYQVRAFVCDPGGELRLGMPATVTVRLDQAATGKEAACRDHP